MSRGGVAQFARLNKSADAVGRSAASLSPRESGDGILCRMRRLQLMAALLAFGLVPLGAARAGQDDPRLGPLFDKLQHSASPAEAEAAEQQIWQIWIEHKNPEIERLMRQGISAMDDDDEELALDDFNAVIQHDKNFAEGWNKRATVEFAMGDYDASIADIEHTLALEPRHFGALSGLGQIYLALNRKDLALKAFRAALDINPRLAGLREAIKQLEKDVKGDPI
jgi:tetratricopeptide (TPR) repeat protein